MQGMLSAHQQKWLGITFMRQYSMNEEEEKMCAVGKNPVFTCPWAKARGQACFGLPLGQGQGPVYCASASSPQDF